MMKGDFYVLEYVGWDNSYSEIVNGDRIRHKNTNPPLEKSMFHKFEIDVPEDVREQYVLLSDSYAEKINKICTKDEQNMQQIQPKDVN